MEFCPQIHNFKYESDRELMRKELRSPTHCSIIYIYYIYNRFKAEFFLGVYIQSNKSSKSVSILFDSGSQTSYVTEAVSDFLNLKSMGHKCMTIMTFGSNKPEQATCKRVEVGLSKNCIEIQLISTFTVPMICEPLVQPTIQVAVQHRKHFDANLCFVYLVIEMEGERVPQLVCSKTRVAPLRELTVSRLELLSGLLLARLIRTVTSSLETEIQLAPLQCFTDSKVSYHWIIGCNKAWKPFVQNRVNEIRRVVPATLWHLVLVRTNLPTYPHMGSHLLS